MNDAVVVIILVMLIYSYEHCSLHEKKLSASLNTEDYAKKTITAIAVFSRIPNVQSNAVNLLLLLVDAGDDDVHLLSYRAVWNDAAAQRTGVLDLFEVFQDAVESHVGAALVQFRSVDGSDVYSVVCGDRSRLGELPVFTVDHLTARLVAGQVFQQVRPVPFISRVSLSH